MGDVINCAIVKTYGRLVTSTLRDFVDEAPNEINSLNRQNYFIELCIVGMVITVTNELFHSVGTVL